MRALLECSTDRVVLNIVRNILDPKRLVSNMA